MSVKTLVIYYSWSGNTAALARKLHTATNSDLFEITVAPDTFPDDMYATSDRAKAQLDSGQFPVLTTAIPDLSQYDLVLVGGPVWSGLVSTPVRSFLQAAQGSTAIFAPFYTHAGSPDDYEADFKQAAAPLTVVAGFGVSGQGVATADARLKQWLASI